jgi:hypothetical protein
VTPSRRRKKENRCDTRANENKPKRTHIFLLKERRYIFINIISSHIFLKEKNLLFGVDGARLVQPNKTILYRFFGSDTLLDIFSLLCAGGRSRWAS